MINYLGTTMTALILVDLQNDFMPGGALPVPNGDKILPAINILLERHFDLIIASQDWHPENHGSFAAVHGKQPGDNIILGNVEQVLWPTHCVQNTHGAKFVKGWNLDKITKIIQKGTSESIDSYSVFFDNAHLKSTSLYELLKDNQITTLYIAGVATEYCVLYSVLDARKFGFEVYVVVDACKGINLNLEDEAKALELMKQAGAHLTKSTT